MIFVSAVQFAVWASPAVNVDALTSAAELTGGFIAHCVIDFNEWRSRLSCWTCDSNLVELNVTWCIRILTCY